MLVCAHCPVSKSLPHTLRLPLWTVLKPASITAAAVARAAAAYTKDPDPHPTDTDMGANPGGVDGPQTDRRRVHFSSDEA